ncbi:hypothetical protein B7463_g5751, partial [Scytalidium lignicola]
MFRYLQKLEFSQSNPAFDGWAQSWVQKGVQRSRLRIDCSRLQGLSRRVLAFSEEGGGRTRSGIARFERAIAGPGDKERDVGRTARFCDENPDEEGRNEDDLSVVKSRGMTADGEEGREGKGEGEGEGEEEE